MNIRPLMNDDAVTAISLIGSTLHLLQGCHIRCGARRALKARELGSWSVGALNVKQGDDGGVEVTITSPRARISVGTCILIRSL
jgi:hypothetical protein